MAYFGSIRLNMHAYFYPLFLDTQRLLDGCDDLPAVQESNSVHARHLHALTGAQLFNYLDQFQCLVGKPCKELRNNFLPFSHCTCCNHEIILDGFGLSATRGGNLEKLTTSTFH